MNCCKIVAVKPDVLNIKQESFQNNIVNNEMNILNTTRNESIVQYVLSGQEMREI